MLSDQVSFLNHSLFGFRKYNLKKSGLINNCLRGAVLTDRERNELNYQGIRILKTTGIENSNRLINAGQNYDELR